MIPFDNSYARDLAGFYVPAEPARVPAPRLLQLNRALAAELQLPLDALTPDVLAGNALPPNAQPIAQAYAGHQFGHFVPQLGDGRAILLGEVIDTAGRRRDIQFKGSGRTAFSRGGDGKAAVGPVLREYLMGEAMHALGIPTTRALAAVATGEPVYRERPLPGAVLTRVAASHIRVGTFQFFAARGDTPKLRRLADYTIARHYPHLAAEPNPALALLAAVRDAQAALIAQWMLAGFIHGVMNTDNMAVSGETIDYGPCAFMDAYSPDTVFSSIDQHGRYAYGQQPSIALWNLSRFAETLLPLIDENEEKSIDLATESLRQFSPAYEARWLDGMRAKLGLAEPFQPADQALVAGFLAILEKERADFTLSFRRLAAGTLADHLVDPAAFHHWAARWQSRRAPDFAARMDRVNPAYIPRNHLVEEALAAAAGPGDLNPFESLLAVLADPFNERPGLDRYAHPDPAGNPGYRTFCGT